MRVCGRIKGPVGQMCLECVIAKAQTVVERE